MYDFCFELCFDIFQLLTTCRDVLFLFVFAQLPQALFVGSSLFVCSECPKQFAAISEFFNYVRTSEHFPICIICDILRNVAGAALRLRNTSQHRWLRTRLFRNPQIFYSFEPGAIDLCEMNSLSSCGSSGQSKPIEKNAGRNSSVRRKTPLPIERLVRQVLRFSADPRVGFLRASATPPIYLMKTHGM